MTHGCYDRAPLNETVVVQDGWTSSGQAATTRLPKLVTLPNPLTKECQYTKSNMGKTDPKCVGCKWREA